MTNDYFPSDRSTAVSLCQRTSSFGWQPSSWARTPTLLNYWYVSHDRIRARTDRLQQHATPRHIHTTSRRLFIGPIPHGWLMSHQDDWYKHPVRSYRSRTATFGAAVNSRRYSRADIATGLEGPSAVAYFSHSFPQPGGLTSDDDADEDTTPPAHDDEAGPGSEQRYSQLSPTAAEP